MNDSNRLAKVCLYFTKKTNSVGKSDFRIYKKIVLPTVETKLDGIARKVEKKPETIRAKSEETLFQAFVAGPTEIPHNYWISKEKQINPSVPRSFAEACKYMGWSDAIDRE